MLGRNSAFSKLVSARISVSDKRRASLIVKVLPYNYPRRDGPLRTYSSAVRPERVTEFLALIERQKFWSAPGEQARPARSDGLVTVCVDAGGWMIEGVTPDLYQQIFRSNCEQLESVAQEIRDFLLELVNVTPGGRR